MNPERWQQVKKLYNAALELETEEREAFFDGACAGDESLRKEIEFLFAQQAEAENLLGKPALEVAARALAQDRKDEAEPDYVGQSLLHYRIVEKIGEGGMGVVYRAEDSHLKRSVAIKLLSSDKMADPERRRRFTHEARAASALNHPNIVTIYDITSHEGIDFIAMEYVAGSSLAQLIGDKGIPLHQTLEYAIQIADALEKAHRAGIVHRDLKPSNIVVTGEGQVKILDFGLAKLTHPAEQEVSTNARSSAPITESGVIVGTVSYMSPEQAQGKPVDWRTDIFSFGSLLYEMITGNRAFGSDSTLSTLAAVIKDEPAPLDHRIPARLRQVVKRCLQKDPERRFQAMAEMKTELEEVAKHSRPQSFFLPAPWRRAIPLSILVAAAIAVAALFYVWQIHRSAGAASIKSITILPLENSSHDPGQEYFAEGMTRAVSLELGQICSLRVISTSSITKYKGARKSLPAIASELGIDAVVEGSVMRSGDRVRITTRLIRITPERQLWVKDYESDLRDVLPLQNEIARAIAREAGAEISPEEASRPAMVRRTDPAAYELYLKGRYRFDGWRNESEARRWFQQAIEKDPTFAPAYSGLASTYTRGDYPPQAYPAARAAVARALDLDPTLVEARATSALLMIFFEWNWDGAEGEIRRAFKLNPNSVDVHRSYAALFTALGRFEEAIEAAKRALDLDPVTLTSNLVLGWVYAKARRYDDAIAQYKHLIERDPDYRLARSELAWTYTYKGMFKEALAEYQKLGFPSEPMLAYLYAVSGRTKDAVQMALEWERREPASFYNRALVYAGLGNNDRALELLEQSYQVHEGLMWLLKADPVFDNIRSDPRFQALLRKMNFPQ